MADSELRTALQLKLDKMKTECDKLTEQLSTSEENHAKLLHKYHALKKELDVKVKVKENTQHIETNTPKKPCVYTEHKNTRTPGQKTKARCLTKT